MQHLMLKDVVKFIFCVACWRHKDFGVNEPKNPRCFEEWHKADIEFFLQEKMDGGVKFKTEGDTVNSMTVSPYFFVSFFSRISSSNSSINPSSFSALSNPNIREFSKEGFMVGYRTWTSVF